MSYGSRSFGITPDGAGHAYGGASSQNVATSTDAQVTATTTRAAIRDALATTIIAITPDLLASRAYAYSRHERHDFRDWADENDSAAFRQFVIEWESWDPMGVSDGLIQRRESTMTVVVAYPHHWALYQREGIARRSMEDVVERDMTLIASAAGIHGSANYPDGSCPKLDQAVRIEQGEGVSYGVLEVMVEWYARI